MACIYAVSIHNEIHELYFANKLNSMHFTVFRAAKHFAGSGLWGNEAKCKDFVKSSKNLHKHAYFVEQGGMRERGGITIQQEQQHNNYQSTEE